MTLAMRILDMPTYQHVVGQRVVGFVATLMMAVPPHEAHVSVSPEKPEILGLRGLGKALWQGTDAQSYVAELRNEWPDR